MSIIIRQAVEADLQQILAIEERSFPDPWSYQGFADTLSQPNAIFLVAEKACDTAAETGDWLAPHPTILAYAILYHAADEAELADIAVAEAARGQGVATQLMTDLLSAARGHAISRIFLEVRQSNTPAQRLYHHFGFTPIATRKAFYRLPTEDAIVMHLNLGDTT